MRRRFTAPILAAALLLAACQSPTPRTEPVRDVGVQMFEWTWNSIANECTTVLGPAGYGWVLTSPPQEHIQGPQWWTHYQPVSYLVESRLGTREEFAAMVTACHDSGVKVIADAVINHMAGVDGGTGWAGSEFTHYDYPGIYSYDDFHHCGLTPADDIENYQDQQQVQECELSNLADLRTDSELVQSTLAAYLADLQSLGVDGFRIDAAKHMLSSDVAGILGRLEGEPLIIFEVIRGSGEPVQPEDYLELGDVFEFGWAEDIGGIVAGGSVRLALELGGAYAPSESAHTFVNNHDTERNRSTLSYKDEAKYELATILMLAVPYGHPVAYSGYAFSDRDASPPQDAAGAVLDAQCAADLGPMATYEPGDWVCQHRWPATLGMLDWHNTVGVEPVENQWSEGYAVAFDRGETGFIAVSGNSVRVLENLQLTTNLPDGSYCNALTAPSLASGGDRCPEGEYEVSDGVVTLTLDPMTAVALHVGLRAD